MSQGLFISFEGSEGCGKSTQIARLRERLEAAGHKCLLVREPGGTPVGERIRDLLQYAPEGHALCAEAELLLFAASRAQLMREMIEPARDAGVVVVADRFHDSTTVYQGFGRQLDLIEVSQINAFAVRGHEPDLTILLDMDAADAHARAVARTDGPADRMEQMPMEFYERVREGYLQVARENQRRVVVIDATRQVDEIAEEIWRLVEARCSG